jgi:putative hemolysin
VQRHDYSVIKSRLTPSRAQHPVDERAGPLQVRLAETEEDIEAALALRYRVFYDEMQAKPSAEIAASRRDFDEFDPYCDHLLVLDSRAGAGTEGVVGTYRMLRREGADKVGRFYSADEYDLSPLLGVSGNVLEVGRSCVDAEHRTRAAMQLMWRGIAAYVVANSIDFLFGCASLHGTDPQAMALPLSYLYHNHLAPPELRVRALPDRYVDMNLMPREAIDMKAALRDLPTMIKGYLRLGGVVGDGAVIDHDFNTVDVFVVVRLDTVTDKYFKHYTRDLFADGRNGG